MIGETISEVIGDTALERIRPDLNIEKWSIWQPVHSRNSPRERIFEREITLPDGSKLTAQVEISFTGKGTITTKEQKVYWALLKCWGEKGSSDERIHFSRRELVRMLKRKGGMNVTKSIDQSLWRLRFTPITWRNSYYNSATGETFEELEGFTILSELKIFRRKKGEGAYHGVGYFQFDKHVLTNLLNNHTKPLLFDTAISFKSEIAQLLYPHVDLVMADKYKYERRTKALFENLGLTGKEYVYLSARKRRLEPALKEMEGKPLTTGVLTKAALEKTKDGKDYKVVFEKKARRKLRKKIRGTQVTQGQSEQDSTGLVHELYKRGVRPKAKCEKLAEGYSEERIKGKIEWFDLGVIETAGGLVAAIEGDWQPTKAQLKAKKTAVWQQANEKIREMELEKGKIKKPYEEECEKIFERIDVEHSEVVHEAMQEAVVETPFLSDKYDVSKPFAEQSGFVQAMAKPKLRERFSEMFKEVDAKYGKEIERIDEQITELQKGVD